MSPSNNLRQKLSGNILEFIKREGMPAGSRLTENALCDEFNVSRTPVRAALELLAEDGVVQHVQNRGYATRISAEDIEEEPPTESEEEVLYLSMTRDRLAGDLPKEFTETDLKRRYDVPRRTLMRVLHRLIREMLIEKRPGRGWSFADILDSERAHDESYRFRLCIEPAAVLEPTFSADPDPLSASQTAHEHILAGRADRISSIAFFQMNADFHQMLADFSGNRFFQQAMQHQNNLRRIISYQWVYGAERVIETCQEHLAIISAVSAGDQMWAANLLRNHIATASEISPYSAPRDKTDPWHIDVSERP